MILVVNPNPALDRVAVVRYVPRATLRPERFFVWPGGSGVHAGHVAGLFGSAVRVIGFAGGPTGARLDDLVRQHGMEAEWFEPMSDTRQTMSLIDVESGNLCDVVEPGPSVDDTACTALVNAVSGHLGAATVLVVSGSLPAGCPPTLPAGLVSVAQQAGVRVIADLQGPVLEETTTAGPWMIKPSLEEIAGDLGHEPDGPELVALCDRWMERGVRHVCVSMAADGLLWISGEGMSLLSAPPRPAYNTIGCGDTLVGAAAAVIDAGGDVATALRTGIAAATDNLGYAEPGHCDVRDVRALEQDVQHRPISSDDLGRLLALRAQPARSADASM